MGLSEKPPPACATPLLEKMIVASRTEILVIAFGILFLVSQLCLVVWILARPHAFARKKEQRKVPVTSPSNTSLNSNGNADDDEPSKPRPEARRSSTWGGGSSKRECLHRRRKSGGLYELGGLGFPLSSPETRSETDRSIHKGIRDVGMMAAALAMPMSSPPLRHSGNHLSNPDEDSETELKEFNPRRAWKEMGLMAAAIAKPLSPRSPRLNAADQAVILEALTADDGGTDATSPTPAVVDDNEALASGFDDPLGVNRRWASPRKGDTMLGASGSEFRVRNV